MATDDLNDPGNSEPTDAQLLSDEARRYRQKARDTEASAAQTLRDNVELHARNELLERQLAETHLRGKLNDPSDMWIESKLEDVRGEDGVLDVDKLHQRADELLAEHPHWAAPPFGPSSTQVNSKGIVGGRPYSVLDQDNIAPTAERGWAGFLQDAARGEMPPPA